MLERIYIDLDGVITDFDKGTKLLGNFHSEEEIEQMWKLIAKWGVGFWESLEKTPWADRLISQLRLFNIPLYFLSSPGNLQKHPDSVPYASCGKMLWVHKYYPDIELILARSKHLLAKKGTYLIDDTRDKVDSFAALGGYTHFWNIRDYTPDVNIVTLTTYINALNFKL